MKYTNKTKEPRKLPKGVVDMIEDRRIGNHSDHVNFASEKSLKDLHRENRVNAVFLAQNNLRSPTVDPTEVEHKTRPSDRYKVDDYKPARVIARRGMSDMSKDLLDSNRLYFQVMAEEMAKKRELNRTGMNSTLTDQVTDN